MPGDAAVEQLLADHPDAVIETVHRLRSIVLGAHPQLVERARTGWHSINYRDPVAGFVCALFPGPDRVQLVFEHGARLPDPEGHLSGTGRQVRALDVAAGAPVDADVVTRFLDLAVDQGPSLRATRSSGPRDTLGRAGRG
ncbi:hypothetical protein FHU33_0193 [Blastococcus colisei]|uniref:YdhG-like domain-containing protein n=1 Tax=Blastococcus colisei TaxID=1564162 RepID=A0A543P9U6_9ACTN|nr:DUF1801 domain-containing protein [Blastococcus colisei]TQN40842.1 hypothetical protein FHU33_0193 [Blastococcus colisei]